MLQLNNQRNDIELLKQQFDEQGIVRIENFLAPDDAALLAQDVENNVEFKNAYFINNENKEASDAEIGQLPAEQRRALYLSIYQNASQGVGFLYGRKKLAMDENTLPGNYLKLINEDETLALIKEVTKDEFITHADGQVTRYRVGDFLTRHIDNIPGETRKFAYVLGLSPQWHPDWGGLLQLYTPEGEPQKSYAPLFNSLTLFDVNKVHSVTSIAAFAAKSRYSITGWFRV